MEVKMKSELGMRTAEGTANARQVERKEKNVPGTADTDRQEVAIRKEGSAIKPSQATEHYKSEGGTINVLA